MQFLPLKLGGILLVLAFAQPVLAHSGGLDKNGCHTNRKTGDYHCHRGNARPSPAAPSNLAPPENSLTTRRSSPTNRPFRNCTEARAAGAAPVKRGDPGYGQHLDRDNDGVGCEPYRGR
ncbi:excalibur calcium-binding domain-containing protein [Gammaproteobacteria bacterium PRO6]|nr:excalibur calcium-binding domain-containing protein [Gammaproteobacteria bacterium PRO6]